MEVRSDGLIAWLLGCLRLVGWLVSRSVDLLVGWPFQALIRDAPVRTPEIQTTPKLYASSVPPAV